MWKYDSPMGTLYIARNTAGRYSIIIEGTAYGSYHSADAAASDVYMFATDCAEWDMHCADIDYQLDLPSNISEWERIG